MLGAVPAPPPSLWARVKSDADTAWDYYESPVDDAASVIGVETAWLTGFLVALKALAIGLHREFQHWEGDSRRPR